MMQMCEKLKLKLCKLTKVMLVKVLILLLITTKTNAEPTSTSKQYEAKHTPYH